MIEAPKLTQGKFEVRSTITRSGDLQGIMGNMEARKVIDRVILIFDYNSLFKSYRTC